MRRSTAGRASEVGVSSITAPGFWLYDGSCGGSLGARRERAENREKASAVPHKIARDGADIGDPAQRHRGFELGAEVLEHVGHTFRAGDGEAEHRGSADEHRVRAEGERG